MDRGRDGAMVCAGQQRLEAHVWRALRDCRDVGEASVAATASGWKAAATGSCLHLSVDSITASLLMSVLTPVLDGPPTTATLHGCPGLRLTCWSGSRVEMRSWDGHGRLVLVCDTDDVEDWLEHDSTDYTVCTEGCPPSGCTLAATSRLPLRHTLRHHPGLHPAEHAELLRTRAEETGDGRELRALLTTLPVLSDAHDIELVPACAGAPGVTPLAPLHSPLPSPFPRQIGPHDFRPADLDDPRTADLGDALTLQLLQLLADKRAFPGDVLADPMGIVSRIGTRGAAARWAQLTLHHVAQRYGLLRYRPRQANEPDHLRTHVWAVSEAALTMAPIAWRSLPPALAAPGSPASMDSERMH
ncbi:hypothetical protein ACFWNK_34770 [Streptomyces sp. NPDC058417]|uniref:hypothetical protein n=1 Tax=unclassified Streptomyces TaxID=2593676 RepID=UPI003655B497